MKIVDFFKDFIYKTTLKRDLKYFTDFLVKLERLFFKLELISNPENKITVIRDKLAKSENYISIALKYDELINKIANHNLEVTQIDGKIKQFSFKECIANINLLDTSALQSLVTVTRQIQAFKTYDIKYQMFIDEVNELNNNRLMILEQFNIKTNCSQFYDQVLATDEYIDGRKKANIKRGLEIAQNNLRSYVKTYYQIAELQTIDEEIVRHNKQYINKHINDNIFAEVNDKSLGIDQRRAILTDSVSNLVIAGAGSGKTLTICGKAKWLLENQKVDKQDIIFLSYSKASADDLERKLNTISEGLTVSTFHSLGLKILESKNGKKQNVEANYDAIIERFFSAEMLASQNIDILRRVLEFYGKFAFALDETRYETIGEHFEKLKEVDFQTLKQILINLSSDKEEKETILKERVKSFEELAIANFYFLNGIKYRYEKPFPIDTTTPEYRQYNPDFTLIGYDIYHEHFGIDQDEKCTQYTKEEAARYIQSMKWKKQLHQQRKTKFIATYSYEFKEESIFEKLEKKLQEFGVKLQPISAEEVREALHSIYENRNFKSFIKLVKTFINLYKSRYPDNTYFKVLKSGKFINAYERQRSHLFLDICQDIYDYYKDELDSKIDFDDMILEALEFIPRSDQFKYKYIIVDEFQDISYSRMQLLRTLIKHGNAKLFAVGDDWQSIYRFAGSDLGIFVYFEKYFEMTTECYISSNFRNSAQLHDIIEPFITANPEQKKKEIKCHKNLVNPVKIIYYEANKTAALNAALMEIQLINPFAKVLLLGRNNFDIEDYLSRNVQINKEGTIRHYDFQDMEISFKTIHRSKGLEEEFVIVINNEDAKTGLPNKIEDDPILSLVLSDKSKFEFSEERRLFYVALTRTKSYCFLLVAANKPSIFISEIQERCQIINPELIKIDYTVNCPHCKSGHLVIRGEWNNQFYGCSNYPYCEYSQNKDVVESSKRCPVCNHFIVWRDGQWGKFLGCTNYPRCKHTISTKDPKFSQWKPYFDKWN